MNRSKCDSFAGLQGSVLLLLAQAGLAGCALSVNDYLVEARRGDPESVHRAVVNVGRLLREKEQEGIPYDPGDEEAIKYLTEVAEMGKDAVNRASAVDNLSRLQRPHLTSLFVRRLEDKAWSVQLEAAKALARNPDSEAARPLIKRLEDEIRLEVRLEIVKALTAVGGEDALRVLLEAFLETSGRYANIRLTVSDGLRKLSGKDWSFDDKARWKAYFAERFPPPAPVEPAHPGIPAERTK